MDLALSFYEMAPSLLAILSLLISEYQLWYKQIWLAKYVKTNAALKWFDAVDLTTNAQLATTHLVHMKNIRAWPIATRIGPCH